VSTDSGHSRNGGKHLEVAIIGGGQTGLAVGCFLKRQGRRFGADTATEPHSTERS